MRGKRFNQDRSHSSLYFSSRNGPEPNPKTMYPKRGSIGQEEKVREKYSESIHCQSPTRACCFDTDKKKEEKETEIDQIHLPVMDSSRRSRGSLEKRNIYMIDENFTRIHLARSSLPRSDLSLSLSRLVYPSFSLGTHSHEQNWSLSWYVMVSPWKKKHEFLLVLSLSLLRTLPAFFCLSS